MLNFDKRQPNNTWYLFKVDKKDIITPSLALYHSIYQFCQLSTSFPYGYRTFIADE